MSSNQDRALRMVIDAAQAWCPTRKLARAGHSLETLTELQAAGWLEHWDRDRWGNPVSYPSWALTPWAAKRLGMRLVEDHGIPIWTTVPEGEPKGVVSRLGHHERRLNFPGVVEDQGRPANRSRRYVGSYYWGETTDDPEQAETLLGEPIELVEAF